MADWRSALDELEKILAKDAGIRSVQLHRDGKGLDVAVAKPLCADGAINLGATGAYIDLTRSENYVHFVICFKKEVGDG